MDSADTAGVLVIGYLGLCCCSMHMVMLCDEIRQLGLKVKPDGREYVARS